MIAHCFAYIATVDYAAKFGVPIYPFGYLPVLGWLSLVAIAMWRHQFVDLTHVFAAEQVTNTIREALLVLDQDGIVRVANRAACDLCLRPKADLIGQPVAAISADKCPADIINDLLEQGGSHNYEVHVVPRGAGESLSLDVSASVIQDRAGAPHRRSSSEGLPPALSRHHRSSPAFHGLRRRKTGRSPGPHLARKSDPRG